MQDANTDKQIHGHRIDSLTGARFLAMILIVISHFEFLSQYGHFGEVYWRFFHNGHMGVDYFFMLSGFGMMLSSIRRDPDGLSPIGGISGLIKFGKKHVRNIYPVYIAFLLVGIPYSIINGYSAAGHSLWYQIAKSVILFFIDLTLLQSVTGYSAFSHSLNGVCWFLSTLFCIYLVSPLLLQFLKRHVKTIKRSIICLMICVLLSVALSVPFSWIDDHTILDVFCYVSPFRRVFYVISGMLLAQIYNTYSTDSTKRLPACITAGAFEHIFFGFSLLWFFMRFSSQSALGHFMYAIDKIVVSGDVFALAVNGGIISKILSSKRFVFLGEITIYIYLSHYNIRMYADLIVNSLGLQSIGVAFIEVITIIVITMIVSLAIHHFKTNPHRTVKGKTTNPGSDQGISEPL